MTPRTLFTYWHQGFDRAPPIVKMCLETFHFYNPKWRIVELDSESVHGWIDPIPVPKEKWEKLCLAHRSDLIRTQLLVKHGGVWADPTVWFRKPLDEWLPGVMQAGVFMFSRPGRDRAISNWFIAAESGNPILERVYSALCSYWADNEFDNFDKPMGFGAQVLKRVVSRNLELPRLWVKKPLIQAVRCFPYMIYHYMLYDLVQSDADLNALWAKMPRLSADPPHLPARMGLLNPLSEEDRLALERSPAPVFKLSWKFPSDLIPDGSVLDHLMSGRDTFRAPLSCQSSEHNG